MCGIVGFVEGKNRSGADALRAALIHARDAMMHRGPDDGGEFIDAESGAALGQRRLSIIDLSPAGHQPMTSACGRYVIVYNGEVYSHNEIRPELEARGIRFRGHSDTEVILESCAAFGVKATVERLIGMFAFALWDKVERSLTLVRDRMGIKPLYWTLQDGRLAFASELTPLTRLPGFKSETDREAVAAYLRFAYIPAPRTIWKGVHKLAPGSILTWTPGQDKPRLSSFWDTRAVWREGAANPFRGSDAEAVDALHDLLKDAVGKRMIADVPLGAFLSGGIDSSTVVALMQAQSDRPVKTFSIGFNEDGFNEAVYAKEVARHLGTDHTELYVTPTQALDVIPLLPRMYDEPFADASQIPTYLVSKLARESVTVSLSGDGGDELFAGYSRYAAAMQLHAGTSRLPPFARGAAQGVIRTLPPQTWTSLSRMIPSRWRPSNLGGKLYKLAEGLNESSPDLFYGRIVSHCLDPERLVPGSREPVPYWLDPTLADEIQDPVSRMQLIDAVTYMPDDILTKVDRASMAVSLEARVPLIDHRVVRFAASLPMGMRMRGGQGKWILRQVLDRYVPRTLIDRPKMGFGVPIGAWLRGPLRDWAEDLLSERSLSEDGLLDPAPIREQWAQHLSGQIDWQYPLWDVLMLQSWRAQQKADMATQNRAAA